MTGVARVGQSGSPVAVSWVARAEVLFEVLGLVLEARGALQTGQPERSARAVERAAELLVDLL